MITSQFSTAVNGRMAAYRKKKGGGRWWSSEEAAREANAVPTAGAALPAGWQSPSERAGATGANGETGLAAVWQHFSAQRLL
jgi:hypothetical protein